MGVSIMSISPTSARTDISTPFAISISNSRYNFVPSSDLETRPAAGGGTEYLVTVNLDLKLYSGATTGAAVVLDLGIISTRVWYKNRYLEATLNTYIIIPSTVPNGTYYLGGYFLDESSGPEGMGRVGFYVDQTHHFIYHGNGSLMADGQITHSVIRSDKYHTILGPDILASRKGYTFGGWALNSTGAGTLYKAGDSITAATYNVNLYAKWVPIVYKLLFTTWSFTTAFSFSVEKTYTYSQSEQTLSFTAPEFGWHRIVPGSVGVRLNEPQPDINYDLFNNISKSGSNLIYHIPATSATNIAVVSQLELADAYIYVEHVENPIIYKRSGSSQIFEIPLQEILTNSDPLFQYHTLTGLIGKYGSDISGLTISKTGTSFEIEVAKKHFKNFQSRC